MSVYPNVFLPGRLVENVQSMVATTTAEGDVQPEMAQVAGTVVQQQASDGTMQPVYLAYQTY